MPMYIVNYHNLLCKMSSLNMSIPVLTWFSSYLQNRYQYTKIDSVESDMLPIVCGVPQGSILGTLSFIIYIKSLPEVLSNTSVFLYADYPNSVASGKSEENNELYSAIQWLMNHHLSLNVAKTKACCLAPARSF